MGTVPQTQTQSLSSKQYKNIIPWSLVKVRLDIPMYRAFTLKNGLEMIYPYKMYRFYAGLRFLVAPELIKDIEEKKEFLAVTKLDLYEGVKDILQIYLLKPKVVRNPKYLLVVRSFTGKSTGMGGYADLEIVRTNAIYSYTTLNSSSTGNHWIRYIVLVLPIKDPLALGRYIHVSNRGNKSEYLVDLVSGKRFERFKQLNYGVLNDWARIVIVEDLLNNEKIPLLVLEYHEAWKTSARTTHNISPKDVLEPFEETYHSSKTHWVETYRINLEELKELRIKTIRITNNGNRLEFKHVVTKSDIENLMGGS